MSWSVSSRDSHRIVSLVSIFGFGAALAIAVFGLPNIDLHGPLHYWGLMDPFCGGTRAVRYTLTGQWALAWTYNPLGILAVIALSLGAFRTLWGLVFKRWLNFTITWTPKRRRLAIGALVVFLVIMEIRQQSLAPLLRTTIPSSSHVVSPL